jgi:hypothetical protein
MKHPLPLVLTAALVALSALATAAPVTAAPTFLVDRTGDASDRNLANAVCDVSTASGNQCTLRAAIEEANDTPGNDSLNRIVVAGS